MTHAAAIVQMQDYWSGKIRCRSAPHEWMVEATNRCNLRCRMCTRHLVQYPQQDMSLSFFKQLIDNHPGVKAVWPHVFGEPLLHPDIHEFIRHAKDRAITTSLSTNITLLNEEIGGQLIDSGLEYLVLPVDGVSAASYEYNRFPASLAEIEDRIDSFLKLKLARDSRLHVTVQMVRMRNNRHEAPAFQRKWSKAGVDSVRVRDDLSGLPGASIDSDRTERPRRRLCFFLYRGPLCVQAAGTILPCPYYHGEEPFGDLRRQTALQAWNSEPMVRLREAHKKHDLSKYPICARCPRHQPHTLLASIGFFMNTHHIRRIIPKFENVQRRLGWKLVE